MTAITEQRQPPTLHLRIGTDPQALDLYRACYESVIAARPLVRPPQEPERQPGTDKD